MRAARRSVWTKRPTSCFRQPDLPNFQLANSSTALSSSQAGGEEKMRAARLKELEELAAKLLETARKLPPGQDRHNALQEIGRFRARITALQRLDLRSAHRGPMAQSPQPYDLVTRPCTIH